MKEEQHGSTSLTTTTTPVTNQQPYKTITLFGQDLIVENPDHIYEPYKTIRLFGQNFTLKNPDISDFCIKRKRSNISGFATDQPNPHLNIPYEPRNRQVLELVAKIENIRMEPREDRWKIRKRLEKSDVGHLSRLLVGQNDVNNHILTHFTLEQCAQVRSDDGLNVTVCDLDKNNRSYPLRFKYWRSSKSYVFLGGWSSEFVKRRGLTQGDEIMLYWDTDNSRFNFTVLYDISLKHR